MARNGAGIYVLPTGQPVVTGTTISSTTFNTLTTDLANALTTSIASDGQTAMSVNLPMGGNKLTGLGAGTVAGDAVRFEQAAASGANSDITSMTALVSVNAGQLAGLRNRVINGNFAINQRAVSGTVTLAAGAYGHDRFKAGSGGCTYTFAASANGMLLTITVGTLLQIIEGANLEGGSMKLSWSGTATGRVDSGVYGASGVVATAVAGTNQTVEFGIGTIARVQYELGAVATTFEQRPIGLELALCQRYLQKFNSASSALWAVGAISGGGGSGALLQHIAQMRVAPTAVYSGTFNAQDNSLSATGVVVATSSACLTSTSISYTHSALTANAARTLAWADSSTFISLSAEL